MKILVTDGNTLPGLAITRSLGKAGHEVIVGYQEKKCLAGYSKYCSSQCIYPSPIKNTNSFIQFIADFVELNEIEAVIPVTDITTLPITKNKHLLNNCKIPFANYDVVDTAANKASIIETARKLNIDIPESIIIDNYKQLKERKITIPFPLVIKPARSRVLTDQGWLFTTVTYANDPEDLDNQLSKYPDKIFPVILQEKIVGPGLGIFMCFDKGKSIAAFSHKRLREKPPSGGVSVLRMSVPLDPLALSFSENLLSEINWQGIAMVEYKIDNRDNRPKLMEINGRFWGSLQLAIHAGVDFPKLLVDSLDNRIIEPVKTYNYGVKTRWLWGDIDALLIRLLKSTKSQLLPKDSDSKLIYTIKFLKLWEPKLHYDVLRLSDIRPWLFETVQWFKRLI
ncbi:MAG: ATP-grasp domain-containing protein [Gammaproteobacteria bacterium]|nr:ATP-grasp domain-containing protein [Gammaproteobacteria bacterium]